MKHLRSSAIALILAGTAISQPARAADPELTVFDWAGFEEPAIWQGYVDKNGDQPTFAAYLWMLVGIPLIAFVVIGLVAAMGALKKDAHAALVKAGWKAPAGS